MSEPKKMRDWTVEDHQNERPRNPLDPGVALQPLPSPFNPAELARHRRGRGIYIAGLVMGGIAAAIVIWLFIAFVLALR